MNTRSTTSVRRDELDGAIDKAVTFLEKIQNPDGSWSGDYGGTVFLVPMYVIAVYITGEKHQKGEAEDIIRYLASVQNRDGGIGLHPEDSGRVFTSVLTYVALRLLGQGADDPFCRSIRAWLSSNGSALEQASWGKFFLALLNLYPYDGLAPLLPELWLLPYRVPFHPGRLWCHARQVYLPMAWLFGKKVRIPENDLIRELRAELYSAPYEKINHGRFMNRVASADNFTPLSLLMKIINRAMSWYDRHNVKWLRKRSIAVLHEHIMAEEEATSFIAIGPVNRILNTLVHFHENPAGEAYRRGFTSMRNYLFRGDDGLKFNGYNSTALWDTAFAVQALDSAGACETNREMMIRAHGFVRDNQVIDNVPLRGKYFRDESRGGWPFSDRLHGWPISDCTAEGFKAVMAVEGHIHGIRPVPAELMRDSVQLLLGMQNDDGSWSTYEKRRGPFWLEKLNPASIFGNIMVDYPFVECTSSCIQALLLADQTDARVRRGINRGIDFIKKSQLPDGSFFGSWAVCFTYGAWFGVTALALSGRGEMPEEIDRACRFLMDHQNPDGGWGESHESNRLGRWVYHEKSQVVQTAWALMALIRGGRATSTTVARGINFLISSQMTSGDWPRESLVGVFNKTSIINYENYRRYFPLWALSMYRRIIGGETAP